MPSGRESRATIDLRFERRKIMKITVGELCEKLDILTSLENKLRDGTTLKDSEFEEIADMLSEYADLLLGTKVDI